MKKVASVLLLILFAMPIPLALLAGGMLTVALYAVLQEFDNTGFVGVALMMLLLLLVATYMLTYGVTCVKTWEKKGKSIWVFAPGLHILIVVLFGMLLNPIADFLGVSADCFGLRVKDYTVVESLDTHGGFHGDGSYYCILDCTQNREKALEIVSGSWNKLPLPQNIDALMYGGEIDGWYYGLCLAEEAKLPKVDRGYYAFRDRSSESENPYDPTELLNRSSYNFTLAVYDCDTDRVYYVEYDT